MIIESPADKNILLAFNSKKIIDCTDKEIDTVIIPAVSEGFFKIGKRDNSGLSAELKFIYDNLGRELKMLVPGLHVKEIPIAINRLIIRDFGDYFGLNVAEICRACKTHFESEIRSNSVKVLFKEPDQPTITPNIDQQFYTAKNLASDAYTRFENKKDFELLARVVYDFLNKLELIIFTSAEKYDFMKQGSIMVVTEQNTKLSKITENFNRRPHIRIIKLIKNALDTGEPVPDDVKNLILIKAKYLTLKAFFNEITNNELKLTDLIESKKSIFCEA